MTSKYAYGVMVDGRIVWTTENQVTAEWLQSLVPNDVAHPLPVRWLSPRTIAEVYVAAVAREIRSGLISKEQARGDLGFTFKPKSRRARVLAWLNRLDDELLFAPRRRRAEAIRWAMTRHPAGKHRPT